jgi:hypothetical protein
MEHHFDCITAVFKVWDNNVETSLDPYRTDLVEYNEDVRQRTGARYGVGTRWVFDGKSYQDANSPIPIPDMTGLVYATAGWRQWVVLNPDGSTKTIIEVPHVREHSQPEAGYLGAPSHFKGDPRHIMYGEGSDGYREDCRFIFDMHTCKLLRAEFVPLHW